MNAPRENLIRTMPFEVTRAESDADGLTLEGYAAVFDSPTTINSWEGKFTETIERGAFNKTISDRTPVLMFNHGQHPLIGDMPLGVITHLAEDSRGLKVKARLSSNWLIQPVREAIQSGAVSGMSFRMSVIRDAWDKGQKGEQQRRRLLEVSCPELGPVVFPAYEDTSVGVRSREVLDLLNDDDIRTDVARSLLSERADTTPYGDVAYADPGYQKDGKKRYPINTAQHTKTAWSYINMPRNQAPYTAEQVASIKGRIRAAAKKFGITISETNSAEPEAEMNGWELGDTRDVLEDAIATAYAAEQTVALADFDDSHAFYSVAEGDDGEIELFEVDYTIDEAGAVVLGDPIATELTTSDEADEVTSESEAGSDESEPPRHSPPNDSATRRLHRQLIIRKLGL